MSAALFVTLSLAGGLGAVARLLLDGFIRARVAGRLPWGTIAINLSGSFTLGLLVGLAGADLLPSSWALIAGTGFLGGYTTFSTASVETVRLIQSRQPGAALVNGLGVAVSATCAAGLGLWIAS